MSPSPRPAPAEHPPYGAPLVVAGHTAPVRTGSVLSGAAVARLTADIGPLQHFRVRGARGREDQWDGCEMEATTSILGWPVASVTARVQAPDGDEQLYLTCFVDLAGRYALVCDAVCVRGNGTQHRHVAVTGYDSADALTRAVTTGGVRWASQARMPVLRRLLDAAAPYLDLATTA